MRNHTLDWERTSVFWPTTPESGPPGGDVNLWMLAKDAGAQVWSYLHGLDRQDSDEDQRVLRLEQCSDELARLLSGCFPDGGHRRDLASSVASYAKMVAQSIVLEGAIDYEVALGWSTSEGVRRVEEAALSFIPFGTLMKMGTLVLQVVPKNEYIEHPCVIRIPRERVVGFEAPARWRSVLDRLRVQLPVIGRAEARWQSEILGRRSTEEFASVRRQHEVAVARCTSPVGWRAGGMFSRQLTDYQLMEREFRWHQFCIELREDILRTIDGACRQIGALRGESPRLVWGGLLDVDDVRRAQAAITDGSVPFPELLKQFRHR